MRKVIPENKVKFVKIKDAIPKPPLAKPKRQNLIAEDITGEALLKMADEGLERLEE